MPKSEVDNPGSVIMKAYDGSWKIEVVAIGDRPPSIELSCKNKPDIGVIKINPNNLTLTFEKFLGKQSTERRTTDKALLKNKRWVDAGTHTEEMLKVNFD